MAFLPVSDFNKARELYAAGLLWYIPENAPCKDDWSWTFGMHNIGWAIGSWAEAFAILLED